MRFGVCLLPELPWSSDAARWADAEAAGFDHAWTYDHLSWRQLRDEPWYAAVPLLAAAAGVTRRLRLGTLVATPNFRHPVLLAKDVMTLDEVSSGRLELGLGAGGTGPDATALGGEAPAPVARQDRFADFVDLLDALLTHGSTTRHTPSYDAVDVRMVPGCVQRPRVPFTVAAAGPRALRLAALTAQTWVTYGPVGDGRDPADRTQWWAAVTEQRDRLEQACREAGRDPSTIGRMLLVGLELAWPQESPQAWDAFVQRADDEGFSDVVVHWPRGPEAAHHGELPGPPPATWAHIRERVAG